MLLLQNFTMWYIIVRFQTGNIWTLSGVLMLHEFSIPKLQVFCTMLLLLCNVFHWCCFDFTCSAVQRESIVSYVLHMNYIAVVVCKVFLCFCCLDVCWRYYVIGICTVSVHQSVSVCYFFKNCSNVDKKLIPTV